MKQIAFITDRDILGTGGLSAAKPRLTARAILRNNKDQYAVMYASEFDLYSLPGGGIEEGELRHGTSVRWYSLSEAHDRIASPHHQTSQRKFLQARDVAALNEYLRRRDHGDYIGNTDCRDGSGIL